jgi:hypothetical protein
MWHAARQLFGTPIRSYAHWGVVILVSLALIFTPQYDYNDWERNTDGLRDGLSVYDNPNSVYPPWGLILLWPYYILTSLGSRVASGLVVSLLAARRGWSLARFLAVILSPFFIWTMLLSNIDLLALLFPVVLWEVAAGKRWQALGRGAAMSILLVKPQGGILVVLYWLWTHRRHWRDLLIPMGIVGLTVVPVSLLGSPILLVQWLDNLRHPSADNQRFWSINNISLTDHIGPVLAALAVGAALMGLRFFMRRRAKPWTLDHTYATLFLASMLIAPYTSNQSVIVSLAFVPSWLSTFLQYVIVFGVSAVGVYRDFDPWWTLFIVLGSVWLFRPTLLSSDERDTRPVS